MDLSLKRIGAYIIDIILVTIISTILANWTLINPYKEKYQETYSEYTELMKDNNEIAKDDAIRINYDLYKYRTFSSVISVVCLIAYFGVVEYALDGQTVGKKLLKIKVVSNNGNKLNVGNYIIRIIVLNNILFTVIAYISLLANPNVFYYITYAISLIQSAITVIIIMMVIFKVDNRGLHDILANTKVIDLKAQAEAPKKEEVAQEKVAEKKSIKEKAETKSGVKKSTTKKSNTKAEKKQ